MVMRSVRHISVIGAGAWGTALAKHLAEKGLHVRLWAYEQEVVNAINATHENALYLPGAKLPRTVIATGSIADALEGCEGILFVVPSHVTRAVLKALAPCLSNIVPLISATKGIEEDTSKLMTQIMEEVLPAEMAPYIMALSGPSFATELSEGKPTAVCLAGRDSETVQRFQQAFMTSTLRVYADTDLLGVQLGGALKNVMALAAGVVDGLGLGLNARAALITRGLAEIIRLGVAMGADPRTFYGLSGVGDLVLTCTGALSRNHMVGVRLGQGEKLETILSGMQAVAEGVRTAHAALGLARRHGVEMPITQEINAVLFDGKSCRKAVSDLMERGAKPEKGGL
ncbi:NAD(P)H-dependent glycerol-3-phosphate dehydrogenase [Nitrospira moscoviensis]|uniref:Glycerol-3-phosphate dehydrogenase [NAD(P)+] n=1 Tax=Nitrospira moscoviensis TaxID=42253 RepID=A0A0K2G7I1_NITMO|nr:NAD(P)H-dependent glycerol-3-phosphate dehydrogenase [Nitrospira moscoviensis]ALA56916.1 Glycerol-3-phosphate dehydrogenase [NAD(P)+] [Nitrospira moscoviensis]